MQSYELSHNESKSVYFKDAIGLVCAENVVPYPPGIPLIAKGELIQKEHIDYLVALRKLKGAISVVMNDAKVEFLLVEK